jgi:ankyrin repeat protein
MAQEFLTACQRGDHASALKWLEANPPLLEASEASGFTGLILAAQGGHLSIVETLIARGAALDRATRNGNRALTGAAQFGHVEVVLRLLEAIRAAEQAEAAALSSAPSPSPSSSSPSPPVAVRGIDAVNIGGDSALMVAAQMGHTRVIRVLVEAGANLQVQNEVQ